MVYSPPTTEETSAVASLHSTLTSRGVKVRAFGAGESVDDTLLRYLRARNGKVDKAADNYIATAAWQDSIGMEALRKQTPAEALGFDLEVMRTILPHAQTGLDRQGGPIIYKHMGAQCRVRQACTESGATLDGIARYNVWLNESYMDAIGAAGAREWSVVVDAAGWHIGLFDSYAFRFLKRTATTDGAHYPELLHMMLIVNAPPMLAACWRVIRTWVDAETREKIDIISESQPERARARLLQLAEPSALPQQYGGTAPPLPGWPERSGVPRVRSDSSSAPTVPVQIQ